MLRKLLDDFEAGESMSDVRVGDWADLGKDAAQVRTEVFVHEQRVPLDMEWDEGDNAALHAVAYNRMGQAVATGRLLKNTRGVARIGRMAVKRVLRGSHLGRDILNALTGAAKARGDVEIRLNAQRSAQGFYERAGFSVCGEPFDEVGIPHIEMSRRL